uniref:Uncharacterized protein n=1 Tax=Cacopsylla melanoneura TaxID=428564 RepID=A0A8D8M2D0_9HEMI
MIRVILHPITGDSLMSTDHLHHTVINWETDRRGEKPPGLLLGNRIRTNIFVDLPNTIMEYIILSYLYLVSRNSGYLTSVLWFYLILFSAVRFQRARITAVV